MARLEVFPVYGSHSEETWIKADSSGQWRNQDCVQVCRAGFSTTAAASSLKGFA